MTVPLLDLKRQYAPLRAQIQARVQAVLDSQAFILGPEVEAFEEETRAFCGAGFAVGLSSGTDAQLAVLMALGIGPGDAVITSPYTFFATAGCLSRVGARPVFVDIDPATFNLAPQALEDCLRRLARRDAAGVLRAPTGERLRAIIPVHLFGQCCDMAPILALAAEFGLPVLEDASQAIGAECLLDGQTRQAGTMGALGWFSFFPSKNLGAFGDAGMVTGADPAHAPMLRALRTHGMETQYYHRFIGGNFRLDALQAAILRVKLPYLSAWSTARRANAAAYRAAFAQAGLLDRLTVPHEGHAGVGQPHIYHQYVIRVAAAERDALRAHLTAAGIGSAIYYPLALHEQECFRSLGGQPGDFPHAEAAARESIALPIFPELTPPERDAVVDALARFYS